MSRQARQPSQKDAGKLLHLGTRQIKRLLKQYRKHGTKGWKLIKAIPGTEVTGNTVSGDQVREVQTTLGAVKTGMILNAAEPWWVQIGKMAGVQLPIIPLHRQMFTTSPLKEIPADFPFVIDFSKSLYFQREGEGLLVGMSNQVDVSMLDLKRFEERRLIQEYNVA